MVLKKSELFDKDLQKKAELFKALAHPARLQILQFLAETNNCVSGDISDDLPLSRTTVNQHIKELKKVGLIQGHIEGVNTKYCLNNESIIELKKIMNEFLVDFDAQNNKCD